MPHLSLEYSSGAVPADNLQTCFADLHVMLNEIAGIRVEDCKSRAYSSENFRIGDDGGGGGSGAGGDSSGQFVHLEIRIFVGRSTELRNRISRAALAVLESNLLDSENESRTQITVEVAEIDREAYSKHSPGRSPGG